MSTKLARVTSRMVHHNVPGVRYSDNITFADIQVPFKLKQFSSDVKRKSAAYDRIAITCNEDFLRTGEVMIQGGDYIITNQGRLDEEWILAARLVMENSAFPWDISDTPTQYICEAFSCNVVVNITTKVETLDQDTGKVSRVITTIATGIRGSIASAEFYYQKPNNEPKDEFFLRLPETIDVPMNAVVEILPGSIVYGELQHDKYVIKFPEPDAQGVAIYRIGESEEAVNV